MVSSSATQTVHRDLYLTARSIPSDPAFCPFCCFYLHGDSVVNFFTSSNCLFRVDDTWKWVSAQARELASVAGLVFCFRLRFCRDSFSNRAMRFCCVAAVLTTVCVLAGCLVARAAPRKAGGAGGGDPRWIRNFSPLGPQESDGDYKMNGLIQRILERLEQRLLGADISEPTSWDINQGPIDLQRYRPAGEEDAFIDAAEVPNRLAIKRKCLGRFQPYAMNC